MLATKPGLFKEQQHAKDIAEEILKAMERTEAKTEQMEIVLSGARKVNVREKIRAAPSTPSETRRNQRM